MEEFNEQDKNKREKRRNNDNNTNLARMRYKNNTGKWNPTNRRFKIARDANKFLSDTVMKMTTLSRC